MIKITGRGVEKEGKGQRVDQWTGAETKERDKRKRTLPLIRIRRRDIRGKGTKSAGRGTPSKNTVKTDFVWALISQCGLAGFTVSAIRKDQIQRKHFKQETTLIGYDGWDFENGANAHNI